MKPAALLAFLPLMSQATNYTAEKATRDGFEVIRLADAFQKTEVSIVPAIGNNAFEMKVNGKNIFVFPYATLSEFKAKPSLAGNPLLAPWANRLDHEGFYANGKHYALDMAHNNVRLDGRKKPIHGLLAYASEWKVISLRGDDKAAEVTSRLEFWRYPSYMAQFPFAHTIEMIYRLRDGILEVETVIENHAMEAMPLSIGYHPYFKLSDVPRDEWKVQVPVREQYVLSGELVPTGEMKAIGSPIEASLKGIKLDDVYGGLIRGESGRSEFSVQGKKERIAVLFGAKYPVAVVYAPEGRDFICFEPMTGPTNAFNLQQAGKYKDLQSVDPGESWRESYWIHPTGF
ncbi:MAG: aldose 1-epimerase [Bryobacteraceae bacterium]